jgi:FMN-dependent NADH-azoreductase
MANILVIQSSAREAQSHSRALVTEYISLLQNASGPHDVILRDLAHEPIPVLQDGVVQAIRTRPEQLSESQHEATVLSDRLIAELTAADLVVLGVPMYNWSIPAALKAYLDQVMRIGKTFTHGAGGIEGLLGDKPAIVILVRGGEYDTPERADHDFQKPYLHKVLTVIGLVPTFVTVSNTLRGPDFMEPSLAAARARFAQLATTAFE